MTEHNRRVDDVGLLKFVRFYPIAVGVMLAAVSVGGYLATVKYMGSEITEVKARQTIAEKARFDDVTLVSRVIALQESMEKRLTRLEIIDDKKRQP